MKEFNRLTFCTMGQHVFQPTGNEYKVWASSSSDLSATGVPVQKELKCVVCGETILVLEGDNK